MVQQASAEDHLAFVLTCLQTAVDSGGKISYETAATTHGMGHRAAYLRLWTLKKRAGIGGGSKTNGQGDDDAGESAVAPAKKRGRPPGSGKGGKTKKRKLSDEEVPAAESEGNDEDGDSWEADHAGRGGVAAIDKAEEK